VVRVPARSGLERTTAGLGGGGNKDLAKGSEGLIHRVGDGLGWGKGTPQFDTCMNLVGSTAYDDLYASGGYCEQFTAPGEDHGIMLAHGYCSCNQWTAPNSGTVNPCTDDATTQALGVDAAFERGHAFASRELYNMAHDDYARSILCDACINGLREYTGVGHSHGGVALTHLMLYYWSGLDAAEARAAADGIGGVRLVQTLGSPHKGTPMAGTTADLGSIFGVGCGSNEDMDGPEWFNAIAGSPWLGNVWTKATRQVDDCGSSSCCFLGLDCYYDPCHAGTDLLLTDPEDGLIEQSSSLPGGGTNSLGVTEGYCHTDGMDEPSQVRWALNNADFAAHAKFWADPTCSDGVQNQGEAGIDCGGPCPATCPTCSDGVQNQGEAGVDCGGPCPACPTCSDGVQNQGETGIDCGGPCPACPSCFDGIQNQGEAGVDCGGPCAAACPTCSDGIQNQGEAGVDCGGPCPACPSCSDGVQNQGETGIDCGGPCPACPSCFDGIQNQGEAGVDCGGPCPACPCAPKNGVCSSNGDCCSGDCKRNGRCA
jgi:hypothetical protein